MSSIPHAVSYAFRKHQKQFRDDGTTPFFTHLVSVVDNLLAVGIKNEPIISAAYLHDVVEDTDATIQDIRSMFDWNVSLLVDQLTDPQGIHGVAAKNLQLIKARSGYYSEYAAAIKIADKTANVMDTLNAPWENSYKQEYLDSSGQIVSALVDMTEWNELLPERDRLRSLFFGTRDRVKVVLDFDNNSLLAGP